MREYRSYLAGFGLCLLLTVQAFVIAGGSNFSRNTTIFFILSLAIVQLLVQLFFFLHLDRASKAPWNVIVFLAMALVAATVVFGSLWIIRNLDYGHDHKQTEQFLERNSDL